MWIASLCFFPTVIYFNSSCSHLSRGQRSPAVSTLIWGLATTTEQFSLMKTSMLKPLWHTVLYCIRAWVGEYVWLQMQPCFFQKILSIVCVALLLLPKCNTTVCGIQGWGYTHQWSERLFCGKYRGQLVSCQSLKDLLRPCRSASKSYRTCLGVERGKQPGLVCRVTSDTF